MEDSKQELFTTTLEPSRISKYMKDLRPSHIYNAHRIRTTPEESREGEDTKCINIHDHNIYTCITRKTSTLNKYINHSLKEYHSVMVISSSKFFDN